MLPARRCTCSYCTRFQGTWTSHPDAALEIFGVEDTESGRYRFGTQTADFLFCAHCGVIVAALSEIEGNLKAVLNIVTLDDYDTLEFECSDSYFDGESTGQRLDRRASRWIGDVKIS
jgi:hypothetical protein